MFSLNFAVTMNMSSLSFTMQLTDKLITMYALFRKRQTLDGLKVCLCNDEINRVKEIVFLGVVIDEHLTWIPHISNVTRKISKAVGIMYKASFCLNKRALLTLYYSLVYPYLQYCVSVWGSTYHTNLHRLILLQKKKLLELFQINRLMLTLTHFSRN